MLTFFVLSSLAAVTFVMAAVGLLVGGIVWAVLFPIRLLFRLVFGAAGLFLGVLLIFGLFLVPLLPLVALAMIAWAFYKGVTRRTSHAI